MFLVTDQGVIVVDPLPTLGKRYLQAIAEVTDHKVTHIVYSHSHTDHIGASALFPADVKIIAQRDTGEELARLKDPRRRQPTEVFESHKTLAIGDQVLQLDYRGVNHATGNLFIYAPRQKVLMLVDVVYPGYTPYPNLGIAETVAGYIQAHRDALEYNFDVLVAGHVDRLGTRADVQLSLDFVNDLKATTKRLLDALPFPAFLQSQAPGNSWLLHDDYETRLIDQCYAELLPRWKDHMIGLERSLKSHCRTMLVAYAVELPPDVGAARPPDSAK
jgi:glyoxylase-like metal-dependent hydrolase (beta-lactamase superfamily II)